MYYTYMLRCTDKSIYTGITTDVKRRMKEHFSQGVKSAKYTKNHEALKLECVWECEEELILTQDLKQFLKDKVDCDEYVIMDVEGMIE